MTENKLATIVFQLGLKVHRELGTGLLESVYEECLCYELRKENILFKRQVFVPIYYDGQLLDSRLRLDLLIDDKLIIELKAVKTLTSMDMAQTLSYLKMTKRKLALLINFNATLFKHGVNRIIN